MEEMKQNLGMVPKELEALEMKILKRFDKGSNPLISTTIRWRSLTTSRWNFFMKA
jgi:hypothetical protein